MSMAAKLKDTQRELAAAIEEIWCLNEELKADAARIAELEAALHMIAGDPLPLAWSAQYIARAALEGKDE